MFHLTAKGGGKIYFGTNFLPHEAKVTVGFSDLKTKMTKRVFDVDKPFLIGLCISKCTLILCYQLV